MLNVNNENNVTFDTISNKNTTARPPVASIEQPASQAKTPALQNDKMELTQLGSAPADATSVETKPHVKKLEIQVYSTYGNDEEINIKGRVIEKEKFKPVQEIDSSIKNILRTLKLMESDEKEDIYVTIKFNNKIFMAKTDDEGFYKMKIKDFGKVEPGISNVEVSLMAGQKKYDAKPVTGTVAVQSKNDTTTGIVTDIDDTIQKSGITSKKELIKNILFKNQLTQEKIPGMPELYNALDKRNNGKIDGDVHYVSSSPVNLAPRIESFLDHNEFPEGSLDLKHLGLGKNTDGLTDHGEYKLGKIRTLFNTYPEKKFILFGDSGEKDPEIYKQISKEYPGRVTGIYINNVTNSDKSSSRFEGINLTNNAAEAAADLFNKGFIQEEDLEAVKKAVGK